MTSLPQRELWRLVPVILLEAYENPESGKGERRKEGRDLTRRPPKETMSDSPCLGLFCPRPSISFVKSSGDSQNFSSNFVVTLPGVLGANVQRFPRFEPLPRGTLQHIPRLEQFQWSIFGAMLFSSSRAWSNFGARCLTFGAILFAESGANLH